MDRVTSTTKYSSMNCIWRWDDSLQTHTHRSILTSEPNATHYHECENEMKKTAHVRENKSKREKERENILYLGHGYNKLSECFSSASSIHCIIFALQISFRFVC